jgi:nicotinamide riboside transporter PnuC
MGQMLSWLLPAIGLVAFYAALHHPWGWVAGIVQQVGYFIYGWQQKQYGFLVFSLAYTVIFVRNYRQARQVKVSTSNTEAA